MTHRCCRAHRRVPFGAHVEFWKNRTPVSLRAGDLSAGGVFVKTDDDLAEGSYVTVRIPLPHGQPVTVLCRVVRQQMGRGAISHRGAALYFVDIAPRDRARIEAYVLERGAPGFPLYASI